MDYIFDISDFASFCIGQTLFWKMFGNPYHNIIKTHKIKKNYNRLEIVLNFFLLEVRIGNKNMFKKAYHLFTTI